MVFEKRTPTEKELIKKQKIESSFEAFRKKEAERIALKEAKRKAKKKPAPKKKKRKGHTPEYWEKHRVVK